MAKVLCFGSLNIDYVYKVDHFVQKGETISSTALNVFCGGKGLNQSVTLGKAGCEAYHAGLIGEDGRFLMDMLTDSGVDVSQIGISEEIRSGNALIQNDAEGDNCIILYPGANFAITKKQADEVFRNFDRGDYIVLQNEISELAYIVKRAKEKGMIIVLNPSPMNERLTPEILNAADWMVLNEIEAMQLTGCAQDGEEELAEALRKKFPHSRFVLTLGVKGSCYIDNGTKIHQDIFSTDVVDTTAAGDTYTGYFIAGLLKGWDIPECLKVAAKASSITVSREGAAPSVPWIKEVIESMG
ncbi:MAG: ribokinase [Lachnospiraceae bacterium]|nr:ribokinase [Lachnospiraceae bacterium]